MRRRQFLGLVGGAAIWPSDVRSQQVRMHTLGVLTLPNAEPLLAALREGLRESYGSDYFALARQSAVYVDKIIKGAKPADLPVAFPTKFILIVNLKTANALNLTLSPILLARADEVIE